MSTYVVIPLQQSPAVLSAQASGRDDLLSAAMVDQVRAMLAGTSLAAASLLTETGLFERSGRVRPPGPETEEGARAARAPRVLSTVGAILLDDPPEDVRRRLEGEALLLPNVEIGMIEATGSATGPTCNPWHLATINVAAARKKNLTGRNVRIGIVDSGIDANHPEFAGKSLTFAEFDTSGFLISLTPRDPSGHGTHVSALAAGRHCGVAPGADLAVASVLTTLRPDGTWSGFLAQILAGLNWLGHSNHPSPGNPIGRCAVLNGSFGSSGYHNYLLTSLQMMRAAPATLLVAAAGNDGLKGVNHHSSPGNYDMVLGVGATDAKDNPAPFSDWGVETNSGALKPDLSAPGVDICSALPGGLYGLMSGTSMASPMVAGAAALLIEQTPALARNPGGLFTRLLRLVDTKPAAQPGATVSGYNRIGAGRLDLTGI